MEWVNPHLHCLCPSFFYLVLAGHAGKGSLFVGRGLLFSPGCFFFTIIFCQAFLIRGLRLAGHCKGLFMPSSLSHSPSPFLSALYFQRITMLLSRGRIFPVIRRHTSCRTTWTRLQSGKRVSLNGPGWGSVQGCRTPTLAILRECHASSFE